MARYKTYCAIFVHIEFVSEISTNAFLLCIKSFVVCRGILIKFFWPISPASDDPNDTMAVTLAHLFIGTPLASAHVPFQG